MQHEIMHAIVSLQNIENQGPYEKKTLKSEFDKQKHLFTVLRNVRVRLKKVESLFFF